MGNFKILTVDLVQSLKALLSPNILSRWILLTLFPIVEISKHYGIRFTSCPDNDVTHISVLANISSGNLAVEVGIEPT